LQVSGVPTAEIRDLIGRQFDNKKVFKNELMSRVPFSSEQVFQIFQYALVDSMRVDSSLALAQLREGALTAEQYETLRLSHGATFRHKIDFEQSVFSTRAEWSSTGDVLADKQLAEKKANLMKLFTIARSSKPK
jgi:hypothetical protein